MELAGELLTHRESILKVRVLRHQLVSRMGLWSEPSSSGELYEKGTATLMKN